MVQSPMTTGWMVTVSSDAGDINRHFTHHSPSNFAVTHLLIEGLVALDLTRDDGGREEERGSLYSLICLQTAEHTKLK